jgi:hypothetical protein
VYERSSYHNILKHIEGLRIAKIHGTHICAKNMLIDINSLINKQ